ncbi:MAG: glutamine-hydrolyzing carbamoyl-phosphate synthase small subunit [Acidiferrobacterales bacterium]
MAVLTLEDGTVFTGRSIGVPGQTVGEVVFNTAMTGYQEILTDPSYAKQIVTLTYPHIGNTGTNEEDMESARVHAAGLVIRDLPPAISNWRAGDALAQFLRRRRAVAIADIDTRRLTRLLRDKGAQNGCIIAAAGRERLDRKAALLAARAFAGLKGMDLAKVVSTKKSYDWTGGGWELGSGYREPHTPRFRVIAYDFGIKRNILRMLSDRGCAVTVVPARTSAREVLEQRPDGVFLSNGPGDPEPCTYAIEAIAEFLDKGMPTFGICLGHQLLALASGGRTIKMKFGHHGANHPVLEIDSGRVMITSQNHGFAVDDEGLPRCLRVTHRSLFDGTVQGLVHADRPGFSFQGHPEASPGPQDITAIFDRFITLMQQNQATSDERRGPHENTVSA